MSREILRTRVWLKSPPTTPDHHQLVRAGA